MESEWIEKLRSRQGSELLGDDAAVIGDTILTVDMLTEGVDFLLETTDPKLIGRKALAANLSDIAAMAGIPETFLVSVALPKNDGLALVERLYAGMEPLVEKYGLKMAGGDTNTWDGGLVISITVIGRKTRHGVWHRNSARPGDVIFVTDSLGGSILEKQFLFEPKIFEALYLNENYDIHAAMDISDGLSLDLHRLARESGCGAILHENRIPISDDAVTLSQRSGRTPLEHALSDGEDFELLFTASPDEAARLVAEPSLTLYPIGEMTDGGDFRIVDANGNTRVLDIMGYLH